MSVPTTLPIKFSDVALELWGSAVTSGKSLFGVAPNGAFAQAASLNAVFNSTYVGNKDRLSNFRGFTKQPPAFVTKWDTRIGGLHYSGSNQIRLPFSQKGTYNCTIDWGDGSSEPWTVNTSSPIHTYATGGIYSIKITGICEVIDFSSNNTLVQFKDNDKLLEVLSWGAHKPYWNLLGYNIIETFHNCSNLDLQNTADILNTTGANLFEYMFENCTSLTTISNLNGWDMSAATSIRNMFIGCTNFNTSVNSWNVSNVTNMVGVFYNCTNYNNSVNSWNVSNVISFKSMFYNCINYNQPMDSWSLNRLKSGGIYLGSMFRNCTAFNQSLASWNVSNVNSMALFMRGKTSSDYSSLNLANIYHDWGLNPFLISGINVDFGTIKYDLYGGGGRSVLVGPPNNWNITDGGAI